MPRRRSLVSRALPVVVLLASGCGGDKENAPVGAKGTAAPAAPSPAAPTPAAPTPAAPTPPAPSPAPAPAKAPAAPAAAIPEIVSCTVEAEHVCHNEPTSTTEPADARRKCEALKGVYKDEPCPEAGEIGRCTNTYTWSVFYAGAKDPKHACDKLKMGGSGGTWEPKKH
jgi:hypothetical protein